MKHYVDVIFNTQPDTDIRDIYKNDSKEVKEKKKLFPFLLKNDVVTTIKALSIDLSFSFKINRGFIWNGADIPKLIWWAIGARTDNAFLHASMIHDFMLQYKEFIYFDILKARITPDEYLQLTSDIFEQKLIDEGTKPSKAKRMANAVTFWQKHIDSKKWDCLRKEELTQNG